MRTLLSMTVMLALLVAAPAAAQEETTGPGCDPGSAGAAGEQYGDEPCKPAAPEAAEDAARDAAKDAGGVEGAAAFERALGAAELARRYGITRLPDTGGAPLLALIAGSTLVVGGLAIRGLSLRR